MFRIANGEIETLDHLKVFFFYWRGSLSITSVTCHVFWTTVATFFVHDSYSGDA